MSNHIDNKNNELDDSLDALFSSIPKDIEEMISYRMRLSKKIINAAKAKFGNKPGYKALFADAMGVGASVVSRWLSGRHNFESDTLYKIGRLLGVKLIDVDAQFEYSMSAKKGTAHVVVPNYNKKSKNELQRDIELAINALKYTESPLLTEESILA